MNKLQQLRKEAIEKHEKLLAFIDQQIAVLGPLLEEAEKLEPQNVYVEDGYANISITGDRHKLNAAFGLLRRHGYTTDTRPEKGKSQYSAFFHRENAAMVYFSFSSTQCRRVKVGQRTREVVEDIFETVCDEQEYPEPPAPAAAKEPSFAEDIPF